MPALLETIDSPEDIRHLDLNDLGLLAGEIRKEIIDTVSETGGHLAPSLGVVELTLAIHKVFNTPDDRLIWDVGHQCYAHKIITGRKDRFHTIRCPGGLSGFPKRSESPYDIFGTGHSSTSISAGLGFSMANFLQDTGRKTIAVIGDGSLTGGMAFEALNHAGHLGKDLIVVLNDNEMSISPNVGALSSFLSRRLTGRVMTRIKKEMEDFLKNFSNVGENILGFLKRSEESLKGFFTPGMLFEALKFEYIGPLPGHDLRALIQTLENIRDYTNGPVLVHVLTVKGRGYSPAESKPDSFHGVGPFEIATGKSKTKKTKTATPTYTSCFGAALTEMARHNKKICAVTAAMTAGTGLTLFAETFPERFFDVGIAEQHAVTFSAGLAAEGMRPVVAIYSTFLQRGMDQVIHDVCLQNLPVTFAIDRGGVVGDDGPTHHGVFDLSFLRFIPNLVIMAPKDENEQVRMLATALTHNGPVAIRYPRGAAEGVVIEEPHRPLALGRAELLREGDDILLVPVGNRVAPAMQAAEGLEKLGVSTAVINPRFIKPLDEKLLSTWTQKTGRIITIEDNVRKGGFGSAILEMIAEKGLDAQCRILGHPDRFLKHATQKILWENSHIDTPAIISAALALTGKTDATT